MKSLLNRASEHARKVAIKTLDDNSDKLETTLKKLPKVPVVTDTVTNTLNKVSQTVTTKAKNRLNKGIADTDVLIIGAGLSGIAMAMKLKKVRPYDRFMVIERRADMGGTWDLFQYPGIRSDSDMTTFCFADRPWSSHKTLATGDAIKSYIKETAAEEKLVKHIRFGKSVEHLSWSTADKQWTVTIKDVATGVTEMVTANFVVGATGYYDFRQGYQPTFAKQADFAGVLIHPQAWQKDFNYQDKKVVIIGSGATAVTLLPALLDDTAGQQARHVTMLQRSPTYVASVPAEDNLIEKLSDTLGILPEDTAYEMVRWKNILVQQGSYRFAQKFPKVMKALLHFGVKTELKGSDVSLKHFSPDYNPWDERLCAVPDGDMFKALKKGKADVVTDQIDHFTKTGIQLKSGTHLEADIIVTATGLNLQMLGGAQMSIDDKPVVLGDKMTYKAVLVEDVPNMAVMFGYTNASWTLKVDVASVYITRLLNYMSRHRYKIVTAHATTADESVQRDPEYTVMGALSAGYVQRAVDVLPKQGDRYPWYVTNNYLTDRVMLMHRKIKDEWLSFE